MALTTKQDQTYKRLLKEQDPKEIAKALGVSKAMIYTHIRAIKGQGIALPARYANVGTQAAAKANGNGSAKAEAAATPAPAPEPEPTPEPEPPAAEVISVDDVFGDIDKRLEADQARIVARLTELGEEHTRLNDAIEANRKEAEALSAAGQRINALRGEVKNPTLVAPSEDGGAGTPATV